MGYNEFAPFPFILPSDSPSSFPIKLPDDAGLPLVSLAPDGSRKRCKKAGFEAEIPPFEQYQAAKLLAIPTPPCNFSGHQKQACQASKIHAHRCNLRPVSSTRTHEIPHEKSLNRRPSHHVIRPCRRSRNLQDTMQNTTIEAANLHHSSLVSCGLLIVKGGTLGAVAEAISPLTIPSPQAP